MVDIRLRVQFYPHFAGDNRLVQHLQSSVYPYIHTYIHKSFLYSAYKFNRVTMRLSSDTAWTSPIRNY